MFIALTLRGFGLGLGECPSGLDGPDSLFLLDTTIRFISIGRHALHIYRVTDAPVGLWRHCGGGEYGIGWNNQLFTYEGW